MTEWKGYISVGFTGLLAVVVFALIWTFAVMEDPSWVFGENMLSDLGVSDTAAKTYFNWGCFITGLLIMANGIGIASLRMRLYGVSGVALAFAGLFLALVGLFPSDTGDIHTFFAVAMFALGFIAMIVSTAGDWIRQHVLYGGVTMILIAALLVLAISRSLAYFEGAAVIILLLFIMMNSLKMATIKEKV